MAHSPRVFILLIAAVIKLATSGSYQKTLALRFQVLIEHAECGANEM